MEKERRTKALLLSTLVVVVATLSIAFASLSRTLSINGIGKMDTASWSVYFNDLKGPNVVRGAKQVSSPSISQDKGTVQDINVKLSNPKDEISYTVDIVNAGTIDAEITMIKDIELTDVQKKVFEFKVTYTATGEVLKDGDLLPAGDTKNITINIKFKDDITEFDLPTESQTINLSYQITYTQYDGDVPVGPNGGGVTTEKAVLAHDLNALMSSEDPTSAPFFNGIIGRNTVESIDFLNSNVVPAEYVDKSWDASQNGDRSVMAWYTPGDTEGLNKVYIGGNGGVYAPEDSTVLFGMFINLKQMNFNNNFDTSDVTSMLSMFGNCLLLTNLDLSSFNTSNVTNMSMMFSFCLALETLDLTSFDTSNVTDMSGMFGDGGNAEASIRSINLSSFDTSNVTNMERMFSGCAQLEELDLRNFSTSKVTNMSWMFDYCESLANLDLRNADFSNVTNYNSLFSNINDNTFQLIVKDETQRTWITSKFTNLTNVVLPSEL